MGDDRMGDDRMMGKEAMRISSMRNPPLIFLPAQDTKQKEKSTRTIERLFGPRRRNSQKRARNFAIDEGCPCKTSDAEFQDKTSRLFIVCHDGLPRWSLSHGELTRNKSKFLS
jgi:hypothetical protein